MGSAYDIGFSFSGTSVCPLEYRTFEQVKKEFPMEMRQGANAKSFPFAKLLFFVGLIGMVVSLFL
jgi:hypothetical protein